MTDLGLEPTSANAVGARLELTREALNLSAREFAGAAGIGDSTYSNYKKAIRKPSLDHALKLCDRFELTLDWIYRGDPSGLKYGLAEKINQLRRRSTIARKK
jgi:transcriptional regulator with XRE-family HTH domain